MNSCSTCKYYDYGTCRKTGYDTHYSSVCSSHKPKQEEKQMKNYITETHEVKLDGEWHVIESLINSDTKVMFTDPAPAPAPAAPAPAPIGVFIVSHLMIYKDDANYRAKRTMRVILNDELDVIAKMQTDEPARPLSPGEQYAIVMLD